MTASTTHDAVSAIYSIESPRLIAGLARLVRDLGLAEELAQDALLAALEQWPRDGVPERPGAWLMATAKHRALNALRRGKLGELKYAELGRELEASGTSQRTVQAIEDAIDDDVGDDLLRLIFTACHPLLSTEARLALTLRLLGGLSTSEIARAFLVPEATVAQRIVRAKRTLAEAQVPFEVPRGDELGMRLRSVLEVVYLIFNEGYTATAGDDLMRPALCEDALRLGRCLCALAPREPEVHALCALMELGASRARARVDAAGRSVRLLDQNRALWDWLAIHRGLVALDRAARLDGAGGRYALEAAISACHARATRAEDTDWERIAAYYAELGAVIPSPVIELNRAMAVAMARGPQVGLEIVERLMSDRALEHYHLLPAAHGELLERLGRFDEARAELTRAASLTQNARERELLLERAQSCATRAQASPGEL